VLQLFLLPANIVILVQIVMEPVCRETLLMLLQDLPLLGDL
jgi:hypothetical protein